MASEGAAYGEVVKRTSLNVQTLVLTVRDRFLSLPKLIMPPAYNICASGRSLRDV